MKIVLTFLVLFVMIFIPVSVTLYNGPEIIVEENRKLNPFPVFDNITNPRDINKFSQRFINWFEDRVPGRDWGISLTQSVTGYVPDLGKCILGKDDWLFLGDNYENTISYLTGSKTRTPEDIKNQVNLFKRIQASVEKRGAKFFVLLGPNKSTIYPEFLPELIIKSPRITPRVCEAASKAGIKIFDPSDFLIQNKSKGLLYYRTDTHWNQLGTFLALQAFFNWADISVDFTKFTLEAAPQHKGDLVKIGGFKNYPLHDGDNYTPILTNKNNNLIPKNILVLGDSFSTNTLFYLKNIFKRVHRIHYDEIFKTYDILQLEKYLDNLKWKPDIVLWIQVERRYIVYGSSH